MFAYSMHEFNGKRESVCVGGSSLKSGGVGGVFGRQRRDEVSDCLQETECGVGTTVSC